MLRKLRKYGKPLVAVLIAVLVALYAAVGDGHVSPVEGVQLAVAAAAAVGTWLVPAVPEWPWMKTAVAALLAALDLAVTYIVGGLTPAEWMSLAGAALAATALVAATPAVSTLRPPPPQPYGSGVWPPPPGGSGSGGPPGPGPGPMQFHAGGTAPAGYSSWGVVNTTGAAPLPSPVLGWPPSGGAS